jgi:MFS transporter, SP family, sugar:H+ symporter
MNSVVNNDGSFSLKLLRIALTAALGGFLFGFDSAIIKGTVLSITNEFSLSAAMTGFAVSCALLGAMIGAWGAGYSANRFGRIKTMILSSILLTLSALGSGLATSIESLIIWRFIGGIGVGVASVIAPAYISEIAPARIRGRMATMQQMSLVIGIFCALLISTVLVKIAGPVHRFASIGVDGQFPRLRQRAPTLTVLLVSVASLVHIRKMQHQSHHHCYSYIHSKTYFGSLGKFLGQIVLPD